MESKEAYLQALEECLAQLQKLPDKKSPSVYAMERKAGTFDSLEFYFACTKKWLATLIGDRVTEAKRERPSWVQAWYLDPNIMKMQARLDRIEAELGLPPADPISHPEDPPNPTP